MIIHVTNIEWDTDGQDVDLPNEFDIDVDPDGRRGMHDCRDRTGERMEGPEAEIGGGHVSEDTDRGY